MIGQEMNDGSIPVPDKNENHFGPLTQILASEITCNGGHLSRDLIARINQHGRGVDICFSQVSPAMSRYILSNDFECLQTLAVDSEFFYNTGKCTTVHEFGHAWYEINPINLSLRIVCIRILIEDRTNPLWQDGYVGKNEKKGSSMHERIKRNGMHNCRKDLDHKATVPVEHAIEIIFEINPSLAQNGQKTKQRIKL